MTKMTMWQVQATLENGGEPNVETGAILVFAAGTERRLARAECRPPDIARGICAFSLAAGQNEFDRNSTLSTTDGGTDKPARSNRTGSQTSCAT